MGGCAMINVLMAKMAKFRSKYQLPDHEYPVQKVGVVLFQLHSAVF